MPEISITGGDPRYRDDRGDADPAVAAALAAFDRGSGSEQAALTALALSRLLVPVVTMAGEKASEMAMPLIVGRDGRPAIPAFTCLESLQRWQSAARPVLAPATGVWQSAVRESCAVVVDIAGPVRLAVDGARLAALASGAPVPPMHEDPDVWHAVAAAAAQYAPGVRVRLRPGRAGLDFTLELAPPADDTSAVPEGVAGRIAEAVTNGLAGRARRGIAVVLRPNGQSPAR